MRELMSAMGLATVIVFYIASSKGRLAGSTCIEVSMPPLVFRAQRASPGFAIGKVKFWWNIVVPPTYCALLALGQDNCAMASAPRKLNV